MGKTAVLVTHDLGEGAFLGHRVAVMRQGRLAQEGTPEELVRHPADAFVARFVQAQRSPLDAVRDGGSLGEAARLEPGENS
jgi:osmoprotectant transport system ATP-binding protein